MSRHRCRHRTCRRRGERGQVAGIEALPFGLLVCIAGTLLVTNLWAVVDTKFATDSAAREAARWVVENASEGRSSADLQAGAVAVAEATLGDHGRAATPTVVLAATDGELSRCDRVRVTVSLRMPAIRLPFLHDIGHDIDVAASHTELVDPTRSGVAGAATCIR